MNTGVSQFKARGKVISSQPSKVDVLAVTTILGPIDVQTKNSQFKKIKTLFLKTTSKSSRRSESVGVTRITLCVDSSRLTWDQITI